MTALTKEEAIKRFLEALEGDSRYIADDDDVTYFNEFFANYRLVLAHEDELDGG